MFPPKQLDLDCTHSCMSHAGLFLANISNCLPTTSSPSFGILHCPSFFGVDVSFFNDSLSFWWHHMTFRKKTTNRKVQVQVVSMCNHYGLGHHPWFIIFLNKHHPLLQMFAMTQWEFPCSEVIFRITWFSPFWKSCKLDANGQKKNLCQEKSSIGSGVSAGNTGIACTLLGIPKEPQMTCHEWLDAWWNEVIQVTLWHWEEISGKFDMLDWILD